MATYSEAWDAAKNGDLTMLKNIMNCPTSDQERYLHYHSIGENILTAAVMSENLECVKYLVENFPQVTKTTTRKSPLYFACYFKKNLNIIEYLCSLEKVYSSHSLPILEALMIPTYHDYLNQTNVRDPIYLYQLVQILIKNGAYIDESHVNVANQSIDCTPLILAIENGFPDIAKLLIDAGARLYYDKPMSKFDATPFTYAAKLDECSIMEMLFNKDPKVLELDDLNLHYVFIHIARCGCGICFSIFNEIKSQFDLHSNECLLQALEGNNFEIFKKLIELGADPILHDRVSGNTPLTVACKNNQLTFVTYLLNHESFEYYILGLKHPLFPAIESKNHEIVKEILKVPQFCDPSLLLNQYKIFNTCIVVFRNHVNSQELPPKNMEIIIDMLLKHNFPVNYSYEINWPILWDLLLTRYSLPIQEMSLRIMKKLIAKGTNTYDTSVPSKYLLENCSEGLNINFTRFELKIPDALFIAYTSSNVFAVSELLKHWPNPPLFLMLIQPRFYKINPVLWYNYLAQFGWENGKDNDKRITTAISAYGNMCLVSKVQDLISKPSSLLCLSRFAVRKLAYKQIPMLRKSLPDILKTHTSLPVGLISYVLYEDEDTFCQVNNLPTDSDFPEP
jgi:ankyrin repeat protein